VVEASRAISLVHPEEGPGALSAVVIRQATDYARDARSANTIRAYRADWADFTAWCETAGLLALPALPDTIVWYLTARALGGLKVATLQRRISAISQVHQLAGHDSPTHSAAVRLVWSGIRRAKGVVQEGKTPTLTEDIRAMVQTLAPRRGQPWRSRQIRDRALLLVGFAGAFRRSELVALDVEDLDFGRAGVSLLIRRSKTDQEGRGRRIGIPYGTKSDTCPVRALKALLELSGAQSGAIFRRVDRRGHSGSRLTAQSVALVVKRLATAVGLDPSRFAGHSLRAGLATSAAAAGASERAIMAQTGHTSVAMVRRYIRDGDLFRDNAAGAGGL
jgi:site-specific recombinase XerD